MKLIALLLFTFSLSANAALSSFYETSSLGYTPLNQAGDTALGAMGVTPATDVVALTLKGHTPDASALQIWKTSANTTVATMSGAGSLNVTALTVASGPVDVYFQRACTITSAAANVAIHCLAAADVPTGKKAYLTNFLAKVNGGTLWATVVSCSIQDTNGSPVNFVTIPVADLSANAAIGPWTSLVTFGAAYSLGTGGTAAKGLDIVCNATGTGSDLVVTVSGVIK